MTCAMCQQETTIGTAFALPIITKTDSGSYVNLYACTQAHRDQWRAQRAAECFPNGNDESKLERKEENQCQS